MDLKIPKLPDGFTIRTLTNSNEDIENATRIVTDSYLSPFFDDKEREEFRSIGNLSQRYDEIIKRLKQLTNGKITRIEQMGNPLTGLLMEDRKEYFKKLRTRVKKNISNNLYFGIFTKENKLIAADGGCPFNPTEFFQNPPQAQDLNHPLSYLFYLREFIFAHHYLHDSSPKWVEIRQKIKSNQIIYGGPLGVDYDYRGSQLGAILMLYRLDCAYKLGYRLLFAHASNPSSGIIGVKTGQFIGLPEISINLKDFIFNGEKPFECLNLIWKGYEQCNNLDLCAVTFIENITYYQTKKRG